MRFRATGMWSGKRVVVIYADGELTGGTELLREQLRLTGEAISEPRQVVSALESTLNPLETIELLEGDFLKVGTPPPRVSPFESPQLLTRLDAAKRLGVAFGTILDWEAEGLLHPLRFDFGGRPEVLYTVFEIDQRRTSGSSPAGGSRVAAPAGTVESSAPPAASTFSDPPPSEPQPEQEEIDRLKQALAEASEEIAVLRESLQKARDRGSGGKPRWPWKRGRH